MRPLLLVGAVALAIIPFGSCESPHDGNQSVCYRDTYGVWLSSYSSDGYCTFGAPAGSPLESRHVARMPAIPHSGNGLPDCRLTGEQVCEYGAVDPSGNPVTPGNYGLGRPAVEK